MPLARVRVVCFDPSANNPADATSVTCPVPGAPLASRASTPIIEMAPRASIWRGVAVALSTATPEFGSELQAANSANAPAAHATLTTLSMGYPFGGCLQMRNYYFRLVSVPSKEHRTVTIAPCVISASVLGSLTRRAHNGLQPQRDAARAPRHCP